MTGEGSLQDFLQDPATWTSGQPSSDATAGLGISPSATLTQVVNMSNGSITTGSTVTVTGSGADIFALHSDSSELVFQFGTLLTSFTLTLTCNAGSDKVCALSNIFAYNDGLHNAPLPGALPLFAGGLGLIGFAGLRKRRNAARLAVA
jgi:hypothetical protein